MKLGICSCR